MIGYVYRPKRRRNGKLFLAGCIGPVTESVQGNPSLQPLRHARLLLMYNGPPPYGRETRFFVHLDAAS